MTDKKIGTVGLGINPGPLKARGNVPSDDPNAGRCEAILKNGAGRCLNNATHEAYGRWLCGVHRRHHQGAGMTAAELRKAEARYQRAYARSEEARNARNALILHALAEGWTHARLAEATGLTRGRISQIRH